MQNISNSSINSMTSNICAENPEYLPNGGKTYSATCSYCRIDITQYLKIYCNECINFILCADCFCSGVELYPHKASHSYRVVDCLHHPIFHKDWTMSEELLLLEGIEKHGLGNWKTISEYVGTKTPKACGDHYWQDYLGRFGFSLPPQTYHHYDRQTLIDTQEMTFPNAPSELSFVNVPSNEMIGLPISNYFQIIAEDLPEPSQGSTKLRESLSTSRREQDIREKLASLPGAEIAGYMPLREDFDTEHNNDAEQLLVDMEFSADDHPSERAMKLKVIEIYNQKLTERDERKKFVIDRGIIDVKKQQQADKKRTKEERDLISRLKVFSRFLPAEQYDALVDGIIDMKKLKKQIESYRMYRSMGIRTVEQARRYETERKRREYQLKAQKSRQSSNYLPYSAEGISLAYSASTPTSNGSESQPVGSANVSTRRSQSLSTSASPIPFNLPEMPDTSASNSQPEKGDSKVEIPRSFRSAPSAHLLTEAELEICYKTQLFPLQYLAILEAVVRECYRNGSLTQEGFHRVVKTDTPPIKNRGIKRSLSSPEPDQPSLSGISSANASVLYDFFVDHISKSTSRQYVDFIKEFGSK